MLEQHHQQQQQHSSHSSADNSLIDSSSIDGGDSSHLLRHRTSLSIRSAPQQQQQQPARAPGRSSSISSSTLLDGISNNNKLASSSSASSAYPPYSSGHGRASDPDNESLLSSHHGDEHLELDMGSGSAYSSLPTSGSGSYNARAGRSSYSSPGVRSGAAGLLKPWQRNALIAGALFLVGLFVLQSSGSGPSASTASDGVRGTDVVTKQDWQEQKVGSLGISRGAAHAHATTKAEAADGGGAYQTGSGSATGSTGQAGACRLPEGKSETEYALMIDAGSTGSRIHVYKFSNCLPDGASAGEAASLPTLKDEIFLAVQPGLSSYKGRPKEAAESLRKLMDAAMKGVPQSERSCTPVAVKATAGLRLLGKVESQEILDEVESWLKSEWPFHVVQDGVTIMDGKDEGVYAWITINYLLGLVGPGKDAGASAAVMDLGGASTQIVFEPSFPSSAKLSPGDHVYDLNFASTDHTLYQHSHLGYGLMQARRSVHNLVAFTHVWQSVTKAGKAKEWEDLTKADEIPNPCLVKGGRKTVTLDPPGRPAVEVTFVGTGAGFDACRRVVDVVMAKDALCDVEPCAFGGVYQPRLMETFGSGPIYALSYFYDRIVPLGLGKDSAPFTIADLRTLTNDVCAGPKPTGYLASISKGWNRFKGNAEAMAELEDRPEYCLDLSFMYSLLSLGYELAEERELVTGKKINDVELGWALGAGIALLEHSSLQCRNPDN